jgi:mono/diheme cytochrome c family protein
MRSRTAWSILVLAVVLIAIALMRFNLSALRKPGRLETSVANWNLRFLVRRASRQGIPQRPADMRASVVRGSTLYGSECGLCHGSDGRTASPMGRWMYPRAADLTSKQVQGYSDHEVFWIIQNGIRYTGMPAFGKVETADHIRDLVNYVRALRGEVRTQDSTK